MPRHVWFVTSPLLVDVFPVASSAQLYSRAQTLSSRRTLQLEILDSLDVCCVCAVPNILPNVPWVSGLQKRCSNIYWCWPWIHSINSRRELDWETDGHVERPVYKVRSPYTGDLSQLESSNPGALHHEIRHRLWEYIFVGNVVGAGGWRSLYATPSIVLRKEKRQVWRGNVHTTIMPLSTIFFGTWRGGLPNWTSERDRVFFQRWRTRWQEITTQFSITSEIMTFNALTHSQSKADFGDKSEEHYKPENCLNTCHPWQLHCEWGRGYERVEDA